MQSAAASRKAGGFAVALATGDPGQLAERCAEQLPAGGDPTLGILYVTEAASGALPAIVDGLAERTGIARWCGGVGLGICSGEAEIMEEPAAVILTASLPVDDFRIVEATDDPGSDLPRQHEDWLAAHQPSLALVHADPRCPDLARGIVDFGSASGAFLVGGILSHRAPSPLVARGSGQGISLGKNGLSALMLSAQQSLITGLSQGCLPMGPVRRIDEARENIVMSIDGRPALAVLREDLGPVLSQDLRRLGGTVFAGLPVAGTDSGEYLVRNIMAIDPSRGWVVIGDEAAAGDRILFCRRDAESARRDLEQMLGRLSRRLNGPPRAGIYVSCIARGAALFGEPGVETALIREVLGDFPLAGFFANGEISRDRLYGHTGILTLFA